jgi:poly(3-hydroxybutyrate) depolymerase
MRYFAQTVLLGLSLSGSFVAADPVKSEGCAIKDFKFPAKPGGESKALKFDDRIVRVSLPLNYRHGEPAPLILAFHDQNQTAADFEKVSLLSRSDQNPDAIVVYPQALKDVRQSSAISKAIADTYG